MGEMASLWGYAENHEMEQLGQKLLCTTLELERLKSEAMEEMRKNKHYIKQLIHLLKYAIQERDEARIQFQKLLDKTMPLTSSAPADNLPSIPLFQSDGPLFKTGKAANSSITESNSLSETYNPVDSLFDAVSSPEFSNINFVVNQPLIQESNPVIAPEIDQETLIIDNLAKCRVLPEKGRFLQAVLQSGPLLQTLLVAGPLPRWRNPPQFQASQIPPVSIRGGESDASFKPPSNVGPVSLRPLNAQPYGQLSCGSAQVQTAPALSFANSGSGCLTTASLMNTNGYGSSVKRQRFS